MLLLLLLLLPPLQALLALMLLLPLPTVCSPTLLRESSMWVQYY
jgi:hypothetical protein